MAGYTSEQLQAMVRPDRVRRAIYTDPAIFEIEMAKIFRRVWLYVGHESLVPTPGDYYCTHLARQPVVLSRHRDEGICVLFNRCGHRGAKVLSRERGNARVFTCMYHGWSYRPNGALAGVPMRSDFPEESLADPQFGMARLPRVDSYRGFVFASFNADAEPLLDYLAEARRGHRRARRPLAGGRGGALSRLPSLPLPGQLEAPARESRGHVPPRRLPRVHRRPRRPPVQAPRRGRGRGCGVLRRQRRGHRRPDRRARPQQPAQLRSLALRQGAIGRPLGRLPRHHGAALRRGTHRRHPQEPPPQHDLLSQLRHPAGAELGAGDPPGGGGFHRGRGLAGAPSRARPRASPTTWCAS